MHSFFLYGITAPDCAADHAVRPKDSEVSSEFTLLPRTARQLSDNDRLLLLLISVFKIYSIIIGRRFKISQGFFGKSVFVIQLIIIMLTDIRRHNHIPRGPTFVRDAAQRYIGSQKTRSKCRRCFTVLERYGCAGCLFRSFINISPQYNKDRFPTFQQSR